jgi:hypothetical protein
MYLGGRHSYEQTGGVIAEAVVVTTSQVTCTRCGVARPDELASGAPVTPCSSCGSTAITVQLSGVAAATGGAIGTPSLGLADLGRGWERRWEDAQHRLAGLLVPSTEGLSSDAIQAARDRLASFFVQAYHLKDALIAEAGSIGVSASRIEDAISREPDLALLADLCNLDKHGGLSRPPRSGDVPRITALGGRGLVTGGWLLQVDISHAGRTRDGLQVAQAVVDTWRRVLLGWGLASK